MLEELRKQRLQVVKIRTDTGFIRMAISHSPKWYSELCSSYMGRSKRFPKIRTIIKRKHTLRALEKIINDIDDGSVYLERLEPFVKDYRPDF